MSWEKVGCCFQLRQRSPVWTGKRGILFKTGKWTQYLIKGAFTTRSLHVDSPNTYALEKILHINDSIWIYNEVQVDLRTHCHALYDTKAPLLWCVQVYNIKLWHFRGRCGFSNYSVQPRHLRLERTEAREVSATWLVSQSQLVNRLGLEI